MKTLYEGILSQEDVLDTAQSIIEDVQLYKNGVRNQDTGTCMNVYNNLAPTNTKDGLEYYIDWKRMKKDMDRDGVPSYEDMLKPNKKNPNYTPSIRLYSNENHESIHTFLRFVLNQHLGTFQNLTRKNRPEEFIESLNGYMWKDKRKAGAEFSVFGSARGMYVMIWINLYHIDPVKQATNRNYSSIDYMQMSCRIAVPKSAFRMHGLYIQ